MDNIEIICYAAATVTGCVLYITYKLMGYFGKTKLVESFDKYKPYAIIASKWTEKNVPDTFGADAKDPAIARSVHKLDVFLKKFNEIVSIHESENPNEKLIEEARKWSIELAEKLNIDKSVISVLDSAKE